VIVADASVIYESLTGSVAAQKLLLDEQIQVPTVADIEIASVLRKRVRLGRISAEDGWRALETYRWMGVTRHSDFAFFDRVWELRDNLTAYDAAYVALAETIECPLVTADARLSRAPGLRCAVTVVPG
jgi:predicted nucleic acid-binding protein